MQFVESDESFPVCSIVLFSPHIFLNVSHTNLFGFFHCKKYFCMMQIHSRLHFPRDFCQEVERECLPFISFHTSSACPFCGLSFFFVSLTRIFLALNVYAHVCVPFIYELSSLSTIQAFPFPRMYTKS